jgi:hypothetical protein
MNIEIGSDDSSLKKFRVGQEVNIVGYVVVLVMLFL